MGDEIFFGREDLIGLVSDKLNEVEQESILIGFHGIGGIGKSALLRRLLDLTKYSFLIDFSAPMLNNVYDRLRILAAKIQTKGLKVKRYAYLEDIRRRLNGETGPPMGDKAWYQTLIDWVSPLSVIEFSINAIAYLGRKVVEAVREHFSPLGEWLRDKLGDDYGAKIVNMVAKNPDKMTHLLMIALAEDLNTTEFPEVIDINTPEEFEQRVEEVAETLSLLILLDEFDRDEPRPLRLQLDGYSGQVTMSTLWQYFLSKIHGAVCVVAGRHLLPLPEKLQIQREDHEVTELDEESCIQLLKARGIPESMPPERLQIISELCYWNPEALHAFCDAWAEGPINDAELQDLRADSLSLVRERIWRKMQNRAPHLSSLLETACFLTYFDYEILLVIDGSLGKNDFKKLVRLSCVEFDGEYHRVHDMARDAAIANYEEHELATKATSIRNRLVDAHERTGDSRFIGLAISALAVHNEDSAFELMMKMVDEFHQENRDREALEIMGGIRFADEFHRAVLLGMMASSYRGLNMFGPAEEHALLALHLFQKLASRIGNQYEPAVATALTSLGTLYYQTKQYERAEKVYVQALEIYQRLAKTNPAAFEPALATILANLGNLYREIRQYNRAEDAYLRAREIYQRLADTNPAAFEPNLAGTLTNLGNLYYQTKQYEQAEKAYVQALEIRRRLADANPAAFEPAFATALNNLGVLYSAIQQFDQAEGVYGQALEIRRRLADTNPAAFESDLAMTLTNLGSLYCAIRQYERAKKAYLHARNIYQRLADTNPATFEPELAGILNNLGTLYSDLQQYEQAERLYQQALEIRIRLAKTNPAAFGLNLADIEYDFGILNIFTDNWQEAETMLEQCLEIYRKIAKHNHFVFRNITRAESLLGLAQFMQKHLEESTKSHGRYLLHLCGMANGSTKTLVNMLRSYITLATNVIKDKTQVMDLLNILETAAKSLISKAESCISIILEIVGRLKDELANTTVGGYFKSSPASHSRDIKDR